MKNFQHLNSTVRQLVVVVVDQLLFAAYIKRIENINNMAEKGGGTRANSKTDILLEIIISKKKGTTS